MRIMILKSIKENLTGNTKSISKLKKGFLFISTFAIANFVYAQESTINNPDATAISDHQIKDEVWKLEEDYWKYVKANDLKSYLTLWDDNFIGYPSNNIITDKEHITDWITDMYKDNNRTFNYELTRKVENVFGDIVIVLYDVALFSPFSFLAISIVGSLLNSTSTTFLSLLSLLM